MGRGRTRQAIGLYKNLGALLRKAGQTLAAVEAYRQALDIHGRRLGGAGARGNYAMRLIELGRPREAMPLIEHAAAQSQARGDRRTAFGLLAQARKPGV